jgi:hypothetical protein
MKKSSASIPNFLSYTSRNFSMANMCMQLSYGIANKKKLKKE